MNIIKRILLFLFAPILSFVFGESYHNSGATDQQPLVPPVSESTTTANGPTLFHNRANISQELFEEFEELSRVVDVAYCVGYTGIQAPFKCLSRCSDFPSFQLIETWNTGPYLSDSCGFIALSHPPAPKRIIVSFRGTYSIANAIADLSLNKQEYLPYPEEGHKSSIFSNETPGENGTKKCEGCMAHSGFLESWTQAEKIIGNTIEELMSTWGSPELGYQLTLLGHSLGGAVAALAALEFSARGYHPITTTFGEPKLGNSALASYMNARFNSSTFRRIAHIDDPVPLLPLSTWGFSSHETEYFITKQAVPPEASDVIRCESGKDGKGDQECSEGGGVNLLQLLWAHRDYFNRLGVCLPDPRVVWEQEDQGVDLLRDLNKATAKEAEKEFWG